MRILILFCLVYSSKIFSQQVPETSIRWMNDNLKNTNVEPKELLTSYNKYDFSKIWLSYQRATIGFIGDNYQRFYIYFEKIIKNDTTPSYYLVKGKSKVDNNICDFEGEINILNIREINKQEREETLKDGKEKNDSDLINRAKYKQYMIIAEYELKENPNQKWSGIFKGILKSFFYISNGQVFYYDSNLEYSDSYSNNQFVGTWKSYNSTHEKKCCWGNFRIPCSGDLDIGDGEFSPNDKYLKNGWENYKKAYFEENKEAINKEQEKWWK